MNRTSSLARSPMPARKAPMPGPSAPMPRGERLSRSGGTKPRPTTGHSRNQHPRDTGFSAAVKLAVRRRAGSGDAGLALCEACGTWLGQYGGDIQHIIARGMGGTSRPEVDSVINAALMCRRDHDTAESRDPDLYERGFWRHSWEAVGAFPLTLHGRDGGFTRWLTPAAGYSTSAPGSDAA